MYISSWPSAEFSSSSTSSPSSELQLYGTSGYVALPVSRSEAAGSGSVSSQHDAPVESSSEDNYASRPRHAEHFHNTAHPAASHIKLSLYANSGLLTLHVICGRNLKARNEHLCNSFVEVCFIPDDTKQTRCKTDVVHGDNNPEYREKFSFELLDEDVKKRLLVSVWHRNPGTGNNEFLGCLSFSIRSVFHRHKYIRRNYYLLSGELGRIEHVRLSRDADAKLNSSLEERKNKMEAGPAQGRDGINSSEDPDGQLKSPGSVVRILSIKRSDFAHGGFGFSISGNAAGRAHVCRLDCASGAFSAGLRIADEILGVNGNDVTHTAIDRIAEFIRRAPQQVTLRVRQTTVPSPVNKVKDSRPMYSPSNAPPTEPAGPSSPSGVSPQNQRPQCESSTRADSAVFTRQLGSSLSGSFRRSRPLSALVESSTVKTTDYGWLEVHGGWSEQRDRASSTPRVTQSLSDLSLLRSSRMRSAEGVGEKSIKPVAVRSAAAAAHESAFRLPTIQEWSEQTNNTTGVVETMHEYLRNSRIPVILGQNYDKPNGCSSLDSRELTDNTCRFEMKVGNEKENAVHHSKNDRIFERISLGGRRIKANGAAMTTAMPIGDISYLPSEACKKMTDKVQPVTNANANLETFQRGPANRRSFSLSHLKKKFFLRNFF